jgi:hypothetical protein
LILVVFSGDAGILSRSSSFSPTRGRIERSAQVLAGAFPKRAPAPHPRGIGVAALRSPLARLHQHPPAARGKCDGASPSYIQGLRHCERLSRNGTGTAPKQSRSAWLRPDAAAPLPLTASKTPCPSAIRKSDMRWRVPIAYHFPGFLFPSPALGGGVRGGGRGGRLWLRSGCP